jgi:hypothetical protein
MARQYPSNILEWASADDYTTSPPGSGVTKVAPSAAVAAEGFRPEVGHITAQEANYQGNRASRGIRYLAPKQLVPRAYPADPGADWSPPQHDWQPIGTYRGVIYASETGQAGIWWPHCFVGEFQNTDNYSVVCAVSDDWFIGLTLSGGNCLWYAHTTRIDADFVDSGTDDGVLRASVSENPRSDRTRSAAMNDAVGVFIAYNHDGNPASDALYQLTWDENWSPTWTSTTRTAVRGSSSDHCWQLYGRFGYHDGTLVALFRGSAGDTGGWVTVSTDSGATWSTKSEIIDFADLANVIWITLEYSEVLGGWVALTSVGHVYLCTGDPATGSNWIKQSTGDHDTSPVDGIAVFNSATCIDGTIVACGQQVAGAGHEGFVLISDDFWTMVLVEPGWNRVARAGAWLAYDDRLNDMIGIVPVRQFESIPYGDPT